MGLGDQELQKNKKPVEIKVTRDAEDVVKGPNVAFMIERPSELNEISEYEMKKTMSNPLVNREAKRRREEGGIEDGIEAEINYYAELAEKTPHEFIDQAKKAWVSGEMDKLQKQAEERQAVEEQERKVREEQKRLEEERKAREEQERKERERLFVEDNLFMTERRLGVHLPAKTALSLKYESKFSDSVSDKKRKEKQKNKKSRLYQKLQNEKLLKANIALDKNEDIAGVLLGVRDGDDYELQALSAMGKQAPHILLALIDHAIKTVAKELGDDARVIVSPTAPRSMELLEQLTGGAYYTVGETDMYTYEI